MLGSSGYNRLDTGCIIKNRPCCICVYSESEFCTGLLKCTYISKQNKAANVQESTNADR